MANNALPPQIGQAKPVVQWIKQQGFASVGANSTTTYNITVPGALPEYSYVANFPFLDANLTIGGVTCTTAGTVIVRLGNPTASPITPTTQDFYIVSL